MIKLKTIYQHQSKHIQDMDKEISITKQFNIKDRYSQRIRKIVLEKWLAGEI